MIKRETAELSLASLFYTKRLEIIESYRSVKRSSVVRSNGHGKKIKFRG